MFVKSFSFGALFRDVWHAWSVVGGRAFLEECACVSCSVLIFVTFTISSSEEVSSPGVIVAEVWYVLCYCGRVIR